MGLVTEYESFHLRHGFTSGIPCVSQADWVMGKQPSTNGNATDEACLKGLAPTFPRLQPNNASWEIHESSRQYRCRSNILIPRTCAISFGQSIHKSFFPGSLFANLVGTLCSIHLLGLHRRPLRRIGAEAQVVEWRFIPGPGKGFVLITEQRTFAYIDEKSMMGLSSMLQTFGQALIYYSARAAVNGMSAEIDDDGSLGWKRAQQEFGNPCEHDFRVSLGSSWKDGERDLPWGRWRNSMEIGESYQIRTADSDLRSSRKPWSPE